MPAIPEFDSYQEREKWLIAHAEHFVVVRRANRKTYRAVVRTLGQALDWAADAVRGKPDIRLLIYAVYGPHDCWIGTVSDGKVEGPHIQTKREQ